MEDKTLFDLIGTEACEKTVSRKTILSLGSNRFFSQKVAGYASIYAQGR